MADIFTVKKLSLWKNGKGAFVSFDERPETFYYFGVKSLAVGDVCDVLTSDIKCGDLKDSKRIDSISIHNPAQKSLSYDSAIAQAQRSTGAVLKTPVSQSTGSNEFLLHELLSKQAEKIMEQSAVIVKILSRLDELERDNKTHFIRENILQDKVGVSLL